MTTEFIEGREVYRVTFEGVSRGDAGGNQFVAADDCSMSICMEAGEMGMVPWVKVLWSDGGIELLNLRHAIVVVLEPETYK